VAIGAARRLRDSTTVDRLVRGRAWIGLICLLLIGLVGLNVSLLKLNAAAGRNAEWAKLLRVQNADLQARVSKLRSGQRIQDSARAMGYVMPAAASVHYLTADPARDAKRAAQWANFTPSWSTSDLVSATSDSAPLAPISVAPTSVAPTAPAAPATGATGTSSTGTSATGTSTTGTQAPAATGPTGVTGTPPTSQQPSTGATVP
jgi:hypothetical protein